MGLSQTITKRSTVKRPPTNLEKSLHLIRGIYPEYTRNSENSIEKKKKTTKPNPPNNLI